MKATKLPSGSWSVNANYKNVRRRFTGESKKDVIARAAAWVNEMSEKNPAGSFEACADEFFKSCEGKLSPATLRGYNNVFRMLKKNHSAFCQRRLAVMTDADLQDLIDSLTDDDGLAPKTVRNYHGFISTVFASQHMRTPFCVLPRGTKPQLNIPDEFTVKRLLAAAWDTNRELWVCMSLAATGPLRRGEIAALDISDCDFQNNTIHVQHDMVKGPDAQWHTKPPKTVSSDRTLIISHTIMQQIRQQGYVTHWDPTKIYRQFDKLLKENNAQHFRFHDLRHYCASYLHAKGYPDSYIQARTGHASAQILHEIYTHALSDEKQKFEKEMVKDLEELIV